VSTEYPDKPVGLLVSVLRSVVRKIRMTWIRIATRGRVVVGRNSSIARGWDLYVPNHAAIGDDVAIGANFFVQTNFEIGSECLLSSNVSFVGDDHDLYGARSAYFSGRKPPSTIVLEGDNFIGFGAILVGNIRVGRGAIIGAGSLVLRDVPPNIVVAGVPARQLKERPNRSTRYR
jgi:chloramphenicol O-acetyltransferase type B